MSRPSDQMPVRFAAIDPYIDTRIVSAKETAAKGGEYINWGDGNRFPDYLLDLYNRVATLRSIINGCTDFAAGNACELVAGALPHGENIVNLQGLTASELVRQLAQDYYTYGGFAFQVVRDRVGRVVELYPLDMCFLRTNEEAEVFFYCENWRKHNEVVEYPAFMATGQHPASVIYVRNTHTQVYPAPLYGACLKACETEAAIDIFHLNNINNNFVSSLWVNFNQGQPDPAIMNEVEKNFASKFQGAENGGRVGFSWNDSKENATTFTTFDVKDFGARYDALAKHCRQQIFTAFRANPNLFGIPTESLGFSSEEYESAFRLFNRTQIRPVQDRIREAVGKALGNPDALTIVPFTLD